jgi:hypothetical protein
MGALHSVLRRVAACTFFIPMAHVAFKALRKSGWPHAERQDAPLAAVWILALHPNDVIEVASDSGGNH